MPPQKWPLNRIDGSFIGNSDNTCSVFDIDVVFDWFGAVMWGAIRMSISPIRGAGESACLVECKHEHVGFARIVIGFLQVGVGYSFGEEIS